ncbi:hypothetical protein [Chroococcidiopsis sp. SAG 2025]|uniref:hypothetical protein n=1 Tax=Chroococcidiopsis sp. SAG 2025 TaxID=171389 RepID=UPI00293739BA|nr:hypothetical protein [Chroococcidiopsis sp. SAG 2025]
MCFFHILLAAKLLVGGSQVTAAPPLSPADLEKILATAPKYGIEIIPPPAAFLH